MSCRHACPASGEVFILDRHGKRSCGAGGKVEAADPTLEGAGSLFAARRQSVGRGRRSAREDGRLFALPKMIQGEDPSLRWARR